MRKLVTFSLTAVLFGTLLTSCGLFRGGKGEKCPAYSQVKAECAIDLAEATEK